MKIIARLCTLLLVAGCASRPEIGYYSMYQVTGHEGELSRDAAEQAQRARAIDAMRELSSIYDQPIRLLRAPQPVMSPSDTDAQVAGRVTVLIRFSEAGTVDNISVEQSSKASLADAVVAAVKQWQITPAARQGKPATVTVRQSFVFRTAL